MKAQDLKNSVLQLAIQGKLVEQNPNDEPASVLLEKIKAEKGQLIKEKKIKKEKPLPEISEEEKPFEIPDTWEWIRLGDLIHYKMGKTPPRKEEVYWENGDYPWVSIADMIADGKVAKTKEMVNEFSYNNIFKGNISPKGTLIMSFKLTVGRVSILDIDAFHNEAIISIYPFINDGDIIKLYLFKVLPKLTEYGNTKGAIKGNTLNSSSINNLLIPLPPLAEQKRIVAKLEEVLKKIEEYDKFEKELSELEKTFPQEMKKSILQYAIQGKLVEQNPNDEPASVLLEKIKAEKEKLIKEKKIKREKPLPEISEEEKPFEIPDNWEWVKMGNISEKIHYGYTASAKFEDTGVKMLRITDIQNNRVSWNDVPCCEIEESKLEGSILSENDILIARTGGTIGKSFIVKNIECTSVFASYLIRVIPCKNIYPEYLKFFLESPLYWVKLKEKSQGTGQPNVNAVSLSNLTIPLPPLEEQKRIVNKVEEFMNYIDRLQDKINNENAISKIVQVKSIEVEASKELINN